MFLKAPFSFPNKNKGFAATASLTACLCLAWTATAHAAPLDAGTLGREIEKTLPPFGAEDERAPALRTSPEKQKKALDSLSPRKDQKLVVKTQVSKVVVTAPLLETEISELVQSLQLENRTIENTELTDLRQKIWDLGIKNKRMLHARFQIEANPQNFKEKWLSVIVEEVTVRNVSVASGDHISEDLIALLSRELSQLFPSGTSLDLDYLEGVIKSRLRLGDILLRASLAPVDSTHVDLKFLAYPAPKAKTTALIQYDNNGGWSFGRDRLVAGLSFPGFVPGDQFDLIAMKAADVGNGDLDNGIYFGRAEYQIPISMFSVRLSPWMSGLHYEQVNSVPTSTQSNGEALELGLGIIRPVYIDERTTLDIRSDFFTRYSVDRIWETDRTSEKSEYAARIKASMTHRLPDQQAVQGNVTISEGMMDLAAHRGAMAQDKAGPKAHGFFTKIEGDVAWFGKIDPSANLDFKLAAKGQWAFNNLDSVEKFSLGGSSGLRAFASGEASGDMGFIFNADIGYTLDFLRPFAFYDLGGIIQNIDSWQGQTGPNCYLLHDVGLGMSATFSDINMNFVFAHQLGPNPGLSTTGLDGDNTDQRYRIWASISYRY